MEQQLMGHDVSAEAACRDSVMGMNSEESVLILIKHCRDMKQQETTFRIISLALLFSCATLFIFTNCTDLRRRAESAAEPSFASRQERLCPADGIKQETLRIHLSANFTTLAEKSFLNWNDPEFGKSYNKDKRLIQIPGTGFYFVYMKFTLSCDGEEKGKRGFFGRLKHLPSGYNGSFDLTDAHEELTCPDSEPRNVYVGRLFELSEGDLMGVWIDYGSRLIQKSEFGAFLT